MANQPASPPPAVTPLSLRPGDRVDAFTIVETIATTGSAVVYKAHDELLDRFVAIKQIILGDDDTDDRVRKRIRDEAAMQKRVSAGHPKHLVQFIDAVEHERGMMLVSEFYPSTSLEKILQSDPLPMEERRALGIAAATAKGLEAIHAVGVVHRDLKPSNILLGDDGGLKICDFGLAALIESQDSLSLGSVRYMAPELLRSEPSDGRADIYSLGVICYEMLAGRSKFDEAFRNVLRDQRNQAMRWMKWHTNVRLNAPALSDLVPELPPALVEMVARMMDKDLARRIGSAGVVIDTIKRHFTGDDGDDRADAATRLAGHGTIAGSTSNPGDTAPLPQKSRVPLILAGVLSLWVIVGVGIFLIQENRSAAKAQERFDTAAAAMQDAIAAYDDGEFTTALVGFENVYDDWPADSEMAARAQLGIWKTQGRLAFEEDRFDQAAALLEKYRDAGGNPASVDSLIKEARSAQAFAQIAESIRGHIEKQEFIEARQLIREAAATQITYDQEQQLDDLETLLTATRDEAAAAGVLAQAKALQEADDRAGAVALLKDPDNVLNDEAKVLLKSLQDALAYDQTIQEAQTAEKVGRFGDAVSAYERALTMRPDPVLRQQVDALDSRRLVIEGSALFDAGDHAQAKDRFSRALEKNAENQDAVRGLERVATASDLSQFENEGDTAVAGGQLDQALVLYRKALALDPENKHLIGKITDTEVNRLIVQVNGDLSQGKLDEAQQKLERARALSPDNARLDALTTDLEQNKTYLKLVADGNTALTRSDFRAAKRAYLKAREIKPGEEVDQLITEADFRQLLYTAREYIDKGEIDAARVLLAQARKIRFTDELKQLIERIDGPQPGLEPRETNTPPVDADNSPQPPADTSSMATLEVTTV